MLFVGGGLILGPLILLLAVRPAEIDELRTVDRLTCRLGCRAWAAPTLSGGWLRFPVTAPLRALVDPQIGEALGLIHQRPDQPWTVEAFASRVGMSRSAFAARFARLVGEPPLTYLTRWRMDRATRLLRETQAGLNEIAARVGYEAEAAFNKAFKRWIGTPPGAYRHSVRSASSSQSLSGRGPARRRTPEEHPRDSPLTTRVPRRRLFAEVEVTIRFFNSRCSSLAWPSCLAGTQRVAASVSKSVTQPWMNRHRGALDSEEEGEAP